MLHQIFDKVYCINLDRRTDRWEVASEMFGRYGIEVERVPAVEGWQAKRAYPMNKPGVIGCALSHYFIIERAKLLGLKRVFIFEDDVDLHPDFNAIFQQIEIPEDMDMLYLGGSHREKPLYESSYLLRAQKTLTTHAYGISERIYDRALELIPKLEQPVDGVYADLHKEVKAYITNPALAWQRGGYSDVEGREMFYDHLKTNAQL